MFAGGMRDCSEDKSLLEGIALQGRVAGSGMKGRAFSPTEEEIFARMEEDRRVNILLVEDDDLTVANVKRAFELNGNSVPLYTASNGSQALEMLRGSGGSRLPAERRLVLVDLKMPEMGGLELLREIRNDPALHRTAVVVMTSSHDDRDKVEAYNLNVAGYIIKPITMVSFIEMLSALKRYWRLNELP